MLKLKQLGLFLAMIITITFLVVVIFIFNWHIAVKIIVSILLVILSVIEFIFANVKREKETIKEETIEINKNYEIGNKRCPKCYKPFDGNICFNCGFKRKEK